MPSLTFQVGQQMSNQFCQNEGMTVKTGVLEMNGDGEDRTRDLSCDAAVNPGQGHQKMSPGGFEWLLSVPDRSPICEFIRL
jgi:hypothetical protein